MILPEKFEEFTRPAKCGHTGCTADARWILGIKVWAVGYPKTSTPLEMMLTHRVCDDHRYEVKPETFWVDEAKERLNDALKALGKALPDYNSAEFAWQPLARAN